MVQNAPVGSVPGVRRPSPRAQELIRQGAELALTVPPEWLDELHVATLAVDGIRSLTDDPVLLDTVRRVNRANMLHWATANIRDPGAPVPITLDAEQLGLARGAARLGLNEAALEAYRAGQQVAWQRWMTIVFGITSDPQELQEVLEVTASSIARYVDGIIEELVQIVQRERESLAQGDDPARRMLTERLLRGDPVDPAEAARELRYGLDRHHTAAVAWTSGAELPERAAVADAFARSVGAGEALAVASTPATLWLWVPGPSVPDPAILAAALERLPGVRLAIGSRGYGVEGFRVGHQDALTTQRVLARLPADRRLADFASVQLTALLVENTEQAARFVEHTLGTFADAGRELRESVLTFVQEQCNASRAATRLYTHRNTLLRRLARADELLPRPLATNPVHVAVALELLRWHGVGRPPE